MSAPGSGPASLQTQNSGMFGPGPSQQQQQQFQQQPQQRPNMVSSVNESNLDCKIHYLQGVPPKSSDLDSLFTDLDPLGTGMSKPFVDKKDFFTASKKAPRLTGASDDSLNNVGLHLSDPFFVESNLGAIAGVCSDSAYTNSFVSSSSAMSSSKFSDSFWSPAPASTPPPSRPAPCQPPGHIPRITTEALPHYATSQRPPRPSQGPSLCSNQLRVALPPEDATRRSSSPGINTQTSNTYGSILELEASPRRFRKHEIPDFYAASQNSLAFNYGSGRYGGAVSIDSIDDSLESSLNLPMPSEPPPALPQRPPKLSSVSPPPLPPKKQSVTMSNSVFSQRYETPHDLHHSRDDIYDFINENTSVSPAPPLPSKDSDIVAEDLVKMSVVELSQRMVEGKLPAHLTGMSLFELVDFISKQTREMSEAKSQENLDSSRHSDIKSSFSDNFVANKAAKSSAELFPPSSSVDPASGYHGPSIKNESQSFISESSLQRLSSSITSSSSRLSPNITGSVNEGSKGFDDDFSKFKPSNSFGQESQQSQPESASAQYDKYAVFRELQMEEEISNALKSPSEQFRDPLPEENNQVEEDQADPEQQHNPLPDHLDQESRMDQDIEIEVEDNEESFFDVKNDAFPDIRDDNITNQSEKPCQIEEIILESPSQYEDPLGHEPIQNDVTDPVKIGNGQAHILEDSPDQPQAFHPQSGSENTAFEENFASNTDQNEEGSKNAWATFEDEKSFEFSSFLSSEDQNKLLNKSPKVPNDELETFSSSGWGEPLFQPRSQSTDPTQIQESGRQKKFDPFSNRPGTEPPKEWATAWNDNSSDALNVDEAFPSVSSNSREKSQSSLKMSNDSIFNSPFTDNFVTPDPRHQMRGQGAVSATPPVFEGEGQSGRASNISRGSANSAEFVDSVDVFDENNSFANSNFKIQAKTTTKLPNSDSVDIFRVSADPFDDEFFK